LEVFGNGAGVSLLMVGSGAGGSGRAAMAGASSA